MSINTVRFSDFDLKPSIQEAIAQHGFETPTPVQEAVLGLPDVLSTDLVVQAKTGSGKTLAFSLPLINDLVAGGVPRILVLAPTRELAQQTAGEMEWLGRPLGMSVAVLVGGVPIGPQISQLRRGASLVVGTPGRVIDHLERGTLNAATIESLILDEGDHMLDLGFRDELESILKRMTAIKRTWLFSATIPDSVRYLVRRYLKDPRKLTLSVDETVNDDISHKAFVCPSRRRYEALVNVLLWERPERAIVFCATKVETADVALRLAQAGFGAHPIHGDMGQRERNHALEMFRSSTTGILVATDVAARGLDVTGVTHVIQLGLPSNIEAYVHRSGRTGRAGHSGISVTLLSPVEARRMKGLVRSFSVQINWFPVPDRGDLEKLEHLRLNEELDKLAALPDGKDYGELARAILERDDAVEVTAGLLARLAFEGPRGYSLKAELEAEQDRANRDRGRRPDPRSSNRRSEYRGDRSRNFAASGSRPRPRGAR
ncbi:DEAD/DEAH box helicase [Aminithiophilus ramosus]|uniref:DEAD/DEAH box helicase n=2 Tax=Synergistales TaxID=649776 RepID=A0A9Q7AQ07_9BACT|nr:DEAD/DEAH box helicase [Aminithiophilus ramosus]QTX32762.1 DEAD/DEAH box helicase [Aminithiophilus ramosus]QVL36637.1 DEAD/DEAH box helicase [Synergistota bacterium]